MEKCGCVAIRENNTSRIEFCDLHASAPTLAAEVARLRAQVEAMRELLKLTDDIAEGYRDTSWNVGKIHSLIKFVDDLSPAARAALGGE